MPAGAHATHQRAAVGDTLGLFPNNNPGWMDNMARVAERRSFEVKAAGNKHREEIMRKLDRAASLMTGVME